MEKKIVRSQHGVLIDVYEIEHEGKILWFRDYEIESAERRYETRRTQEDDSDGTYLEIRRYD